MKLKDQVCSLKLAKELKELGVKQESLWWWSLRGQMGWTIENNFFMKTTATRGKNYCSAFTVAELGEKLAKAFYQLPGTMIMNPQGKFKKLWTTITGFDNEAENRAKMLIYLKKQEGG